MNLASPEFWYHYRRLPPEIRAQADKNFELLKHQASHPSLRLKKVGEYWSVRVGLRYRALATEHPDGLNWFWIGGHEEYEKLING